ncbi:MAG: uroporphyrinogen-III synthase [Comamonas sp.]|nr:uroporphyrinogen-III synthase [Candidatus Comamonas equi]
MRPLVVTRPQPEAALWVQQLQAAGQAAVACIPMLEIGPSQNLLAQAAVRAALAQLHTYNALMFVSGNAVRYMVRNFQSQGVCPQPTTRLWAPGPGTAQALRDHGFAAQHIDQPSSDAAQFDSEALWAQVALQVQPGWRILLVRGSTPEADSPATGHGRQWLTEQLLQRGAQVDFAPVYERSAPVLTPAMQTSIAQLRAQSAIWLFSSSECLQNLVSCVSNTSWQDQTALVTHPKIAQQARQLGFGRVIHTQPTVHAVAGSIKSLHDL